MKTPRMILLVSLAGYAGFAAAQAELQPAPQTEPQLRHAEMSHFDVVDANKDGFLSIDEASKAFNDLVIIDANENGYVEKGEAEAALPGLRYTNDTHEDNEDRVGPAEYSMMAEQFVQGYIDEESEL